MAKYWIFFMGCLSGLDGYNAGVTLGFIFVAHDKRADCRVFEVVPRHVAVVAVDSGWRQAHFPPYFADCALEAGCVNFEPMNPTIVGLACVGVGDFDKENGLHDVAFQVVLGWIDRLRNNGQPFRCPAWGKNGVNLTPLFESDRGFQFSDQRIELCLRHARVEDERFDGGIGLAWCFDGFFLRLRGVLRCELRLLWMQLEDAR